MRYVQGLLLVALAFYAIDAQSVTYYWKGGNSWADYGTLSNWSTESATGADATALPGADDKVESQTCYFDLGGLEYTLGSKDEGSGSGSGKLQVRNGILHIKKSSSVQNAGGEVLDGGELVIESDAIFTIGLWNGATCGFDVKQGGVFQIDGRLDLWNGNVWRRFYIEWSCEIFW